MKSRILICFIALCAFFITSCTKKDEKPGSDSLPASIQQMVDNAKEDCPVCGLNIYLYKWNNSYVYSSTCNGPTCNCLILYYDHKGNLIQEDEVLRKDIAENAVLIKEVWSCTQ